jgi:glycosyltransferase involved in cell wall biosynthesis
VNKLRVVGDPNNTPSCSSEIIISNLNDGLRKLDLYDESGITVVYDCLAQRYHYRPSHIICAYETSIPSLVFNNAGDSDLIGVSLQNQAFFINGGIPKERTHSMLLGVDSDLWSPKRREQRDKFIFGMMCDSNTRAAYSELLVAFGQAFGGRKDIELYIKDRWATPEFKLLVQTLANHYKIIINHDDTHVTDKQQEVGIYANLDCHIFLNRTSTFALTVAQGMAMQLPTIVMDYSGPRDYCNELNASLVKFYLEDITPLRLLQLQQQGYRNYLLAQPELFIRQPQWAQPLIESVRDAMIKVYEDKSYRENIAYNARATAEALTWDRAALNLAWIVNK